MTDPTAIITFILKSINGIYNLRLDLRNSQLYLETMQFEITQLQMNIQKLKSQRHSYPWSLPQQDFQDISNTVDECDRNLHELGTIFFNCSRRTSWTGRLFDAVVLQFVYKSELDMRVRSLEKSAKGFANLYAK